MSALQPLRITATHYDNFWHRQHFKGFDNKRNYCTILGESGIYSFCGEPEFPIRADVDIVEVDKQGNFVKQWQKGSDNETRNHNALAGNNGF